MAVNSSKVIVKCSVFFLVYYDEEHLSPHLTKLLHQSSIRIQHWKAECTRDCVEKRIMRT